MKVMSLGAIDFLQDLNKPEHRDWHAEWFKAKTHWDRLAIIRQSYMEKTPLILKAYKGRIGPYWLPWTQTFTDIESVTWNMIRAMGIPLYPQYPVLNYFLDFANPLYRVGLEVDGKHWHKDKEKDRARDSKMARLGWHIYRCTGAEVHRYVELPCNVADGMQDRQAHEYYLETVEGVLTAMARNYGMWSTVSSHHPYADLMIRTLESHRLADFPIPVPDVEE